MLARNVVRSSAGRDMIAIREHGLAAESLGVDVRRVRLKAFITSSIFIGVAGSLYAIVIGVSCSDSFQLIV